VGEACSTYEAEDKRIQAFYGEIQYKGQFEDLVAEWTDVAGVCADDNEQSAPPTPTPQKTGNLLMN